MVLPYVHISPTTEHTLAQTLYAVFLEEAKDQQCKGARGSERWKKMSRTAHERLIGWKGSIGLPD